MKFSRWLAAALLLTCSLLFMSCFSSDEVKIGVIVPDKGSLAEYGYQIKSGIEVAMEEITANTKLQKKYTLVWKNEDESNPQAIEAAFLELVEKDKVTAVIGPASSAGTLRLSALANKHRVLLISPAASSPEINTDGGDYVYRNYPSDTLEAQTLSNAVFQGMRLQKVLMVRAENTYSEGITYEMLKFGRQNSRVIPTRVVKFSSDSSKVDWKATVDDIVSMQPHGLFLAAYTDQLIPLIREIKTRPELAHVYLFTGSAFAAPKAVEELGSEALEGMIVTYYPWDPHDGTNPAVAEFGKKFTASKHVPPSVYAATGYDALKIAVETIDGVNHLVPDTLKEYMNKTNFVGLLGETDFNKSGSVTRIPAVYRMVAGVPQLLKPEDLQAIKETILTDERYDISSLLVETPAADGTAPAAPADGAAPAAPVEGAAPAEAAPAP